MKASMPQLPGIVYGVAYEDVMGGVSVDVANHDDDELIESLMEKHTDLELVCIVPASQLQEYIAAEVAKKLKSKVED
jgi:hypothetical protein